MNGNDWTENFYHDSKGKVLGTISEYNGQYKALFNNVFIGWYISADYAKNAIEEAHSDAVGISTPRMP